MKATRTDQISNHQRSLYDSDYYLWLQQTFKQLQERNAENLDWENLAEEIEGLSRSERNKVNSYLYRLLIHLLCYQYWYTEQPWSGKGWQVEIRNFRFELEQLLESKTLSNYYLETIEKTYGKARQAVIEKSSLPEVVFPESCPYTSKQILDFDYLPDS
ncbi:MAG: DUF29 domain-containing protein [Cyanophyceae cyanobacterium]